MYFVLIVLFTFSFCFAAQLHVPEDYPTIPEAVAAAAAQRVLDSRKGRKRPVAWSNPWRRMRGSW